MTLLEGLIKAADALIRALTPAVDMLLPFKRELAIMACGIVVLAVIIAGIYVAIAGRAKVPDRWYKRMHRKGLI